MDNTNTVLDYKCPCCGAGLKFAGDVQVMTCEYCDTQFEVEAIKAYNEELKPNVFHWEHQTSNGWTEDEQSALQTFVCQSCGGELTTDEHTAATFCPYCGNPTILPGRLSGVVRPDGVVPFQNTKEDAKNAFKEFCKKKPLLPKDFASAHRIEKITGIYIPFWLYDCDGAFQGQFKATRVRHWSDAHYHYTKTDHYLLKRQASAEFHNIPMDASSKFSDEIMESIEPFDYSKMVDFESAYLSGFFADKYDVESSSGQKRIEQRVEDTLKDYLKETYMGYTTVVPTTNQLQVDHGKAKYVLLPAWILHTKYQDKTYLFAMNGQTGKMTGTFPICPKRSFAWFSGICAAVTALLSLIMIMFG